MEKVNYFIQLINESTGAKIATTCNEYVYYRNMKKRIERMLRNMPGFRIQVLEDRPDTIVIDWGMLTNIIE